MHDGQFDELGAFNLISQSIKASNLTMVPPAGNIDARRLNSPALQVRVLWHQEFDLKLRSFVVLNHPNILAIWRIGIAGKDEANVHPAIVFSIDELHFFALPAEL